MFSVSKIILLHHCKWFSTQKVVGIRLYVACIFQIIRISCNGYSFTLYFYNHTLILIWYLNLWEKHSGTHNYHRHKEKELFSYASYNLALEKIRYIISFAPTQFTIKNIEIGNKSFCHQKRTFSNSRVIYCKNI